MTTANQHSRSPGDRAESAAHVASGTPIIARPASSFMEAPLNTTSTQALRTHLDTADRNWFAAHPSAQWRKRCYVPGENATTDQFRPGVTHSLVFRRPDGSLVYRYFRAVDA